MSEYQLAPLKDEKKIEEFICDLFNEIENTKSYSNNIDYQIFGVKGQNQKKDCTFRTASFFDNLFFIIFNDYFL